MESDRLTESEKPNILLVMADQMVPFLTGAYGHPVVKTPNLDRLVHDGIRFDAAYSPCPICAPARASLLTGKHVSSIGAYDNAAPVGSDEPTFAHYLSIAGYDTVASGKMHWVGPDQLHGFERRLTTDIFPSGYQWVAAREAQGDYADLHAMPIAIDYVTAGVRQWSLQLEYDEETHFRALQYIQQRRMQVGGTMQKPAQERDPRPFLLMASYAHPHEPFHVTQQMWDEYEEAEIELPSFPENLDESYSMMDRWLNAFHGVHRIDLQNAENLYNMRRAYYALVTYVDRKVGELVEALENVGLLDNTIVIFCSDHGDMLGEKGMVQKRTFYEWSARVPLIVRFPDGRHAGKSIRQPVSLMDLAPTVLDMAGIEEDIRLPMDGQSLMGLIDDTDAGERTVFSEIHSEGVCATCFMARKGKYKYVYIHGHEPQLFHLEADPGEWANLAGRPAYQEMEEYLRAEILHRFDPEEIERDVRESLRKRQLIRRANQVSHVSWDYDPPFDASKLYWREG
jgi:choline-sulfatase